MKWQPIATAPQDGAEVLLFCLSKKYDDTFRIVGYFSAAWNQWEIDGVDDCFRNDLKPTHWMPLPEPPDDKS